MNREQKKTILLVEDETLIAVQEAKSIMKSGYDVITVNSGEKAVDEALGNENISMILMDIDLGKGINGPEAARRIIEKRNIPIIFLTSHSEKKYVETVKEITRYGYVSKNSGDFILQSSIAMAFELFETHMELIKELNNRRQIEETLHNSENHYRGLIDLAVDGILTGSNEGIIISANQQFCAMVGMKEDELIGKHISNVPFTRESIAKSPLRFDLLREGKIVISERTIIRPDTSEVVIEMRTKMMPDGSYQSIYRDITIRKQMEESLEESREKYRSLSEAAYEAIFISEKGKCLEQNRRAEELFGYTAEEAVGRFGTEWIVPEDRDIVMKNMMSGYELPYEVTGLRKDGSTFPALIRGRMMHFKGRAVRVTSMSDITDRKEHEKELLKIEKLESLGILAGGIAHDFNNILTGIMGNISFARMFLEAGHKSFKPLVEAEKASVRATELAYQLLTFARGGEPVKKTVSVSHLAGETVSLVLHGSNVRGTVDIPDSIHAIEADEGQLSQVFHNIILNAVQAMPEGGSLTIHAQNENLPGANAMSLAPGSYVKLSFADQGSGITEENLKRIFDPYFTTRPAGNGLGLASVHSIINRHGGHIGASSAAGKGTTFTIYLPSTGRVYSDYQTGTVTQDTFEHAGGSVLVMDDEETIRDMVSKILENMGYKVETCRNGEEAIASFTSAWESGEPFSAVIVDLTIPGGMGGKETAMQILAIDPNACLVVSSGYSNDPIMSDYGSYGFAGAVAKPYNITELGRLMKSVLSSR